MQIKQFRLVNYKSFEDSGWLRFSSGFTVVVGKNNAGKTALLEVIKIVGLTSKPHRKLLIPSGRLLDPLSIAEAEIVVTGPELESAQLASGIQIKLPIPVSDGSANNGYKFGEATYSRSEFPILLRARSGEGIFSPKYPSHRLFEPEDQKYFVLSTPTEDRQSVQFSDAHPGEDDSLPSLVEQMLAKNIYSFRAERLNIGRTGITNTAQLLPDGSNLAAVLLTLQSNSSRFDRFNRHVSEIFPTIQRISIVPVEANQVEVRVWSVDPATERTDLAISLQESGTGVGQVLAILCVAMTLEKGTIVIDEPNSFLHPGASKKLIQILRKYDQHQYILATHSGDLIATADPEVIHLVTWGDGRSSVKEIDKAQINYLREILIEVGASFSDFFGYDQAIWVEGPTEEACFPLITRKLLGDKHLGLIFLAVKHTGDFERKTNQKKLVWDVYKKLTTGMPLLPSKVSFCFDRERRSQKEMEELRRESGNRVQFLPRLCFENYLLDPDGIAAVLSSSSGDSSVSATDVVGWVASNGEKFLDKQFQWSGEMSDPNWLVNVDAAKLLTNLFDEMSGTNLEYRKTTHSLLLTEWILEHKPKLLREVAEFIELLVASADEPVID
jgi:predicted ATPase